MHFAGVPWVLFAQPDAMLKFQQMLPFPSNFNLYFWSSSGQLFSARVNLRLLLGCAGPLPGFVASVFFGGG